MNKFISPAYKIVAVILVVYSLVYGMISELPDLGGLAQSSRNLFYHVPMWFATMTLAGVSLFFSLQYLRKTDPDKPAIEDALYADIKAREAAKVAAVFNSLGLATGIIWQRVTWGADLGSGNFSAWWAWDPVQVCALVALLIYLAYFLLRSSFAEPDKRARMAAVYNIFAFASLIPLFFIIPKMLPGLHPTAEKGSFIFDRSQINSAFRIILYPGMLGFVLLSVWVYELRMRLELVKYRYDELIADRLFKAKK